MDCSKVAALICGTTETLQDNIVNLLSVIEENEPLQTRDSLDTVLRQLRQPGRPNIDHETERDVVEYLEKIACGLYGNYVSLATTESVERVSIVDKPREIGAVVEKTFPVNSAVVAARFQNMAIENPPVLMLSDVPNLVESRDTVTTRETSSESVSSAALVSETVPNGEERPLPISPERQSIVPACVIASSMALAAFTATNTINNSYSTSKNKRLQTLATPLPAKEPERKISAASQTDNVRDVDVAGERFVKTEFEVREEKNETRNGETWEPIIEELTSVELPSSLRASVDRARDFINGESHSTSIAKRSTFFDSEERSYEEAVATITSQLGEFDYEKNNSNLLHIQNDASALVLSDYHTRGFKIDKQSSSRKQQLQFEVSRRIDLAKGFAGKRKNNPRKLSDLPAVPDEPLVNQSNIQKSTVDQNSLPSSSTVATESVKLDRLFEVPPTHPGRKRRHPETSSQRQSRTLLRIDAATLKQETAINKQKPEIAFGRRVHSVHNIKGRAETDPPTTASVTAKQSNRNGDENEHQEEQMKESPARKEGEAETFINGLVDALLTTSSDAIEMSRSANIPKPIKLSNDMYLPMNWKDGYRIHIPQWNDIHSTDSVQETPNLAPRHQREITNQFQTQPLVDSSTSDDMLNAFLSQVAKNTMVETSRSESLDDKRRPLEGSESRPSDAVFASPISQPGKKMNLIAAEVTSVEQEINTDSAADDVKENDGQAQISGRSERQEGETVMAAELLSSLPRPNRLWRPTEEFYAPFTSDSAANDSSDQSTSHEMDARADIPLSSKMSSSDKSIKSHSTGNRGGGCVRDQPQWKQFRNRHYKAQRQRLIRRYGICDPLLVTSDSESKETSESAFSHCFNQQDLESIV